jgi:hypothetical protein
MVMPVGTGPATWVVRSTGNLTGGVLSGQTPAQGYAAQLAQLYNGALPVKGGFLAANPIVIIGSNSDAAPLSGSDNCGATDTMGLVAAAADISGNTHQISVRNSFSRAALLDSTHIDWASLLAGNFTPDYTVNPSWPGSWSGYPTFYAPGDLTLSGNRTGTLVVAGNLTVQFGAIWRGIIILGGRLIGPAYSGTYIRGAVITGLNNLVTPGSVGTDTIYRGYNGFRWDSCETAFAVAGMVGMSTMRHTFIDTWSAY